MLSKSVDLLGGLALALGTASTLGLADLEAVLESPGNVLEVAHAAGTDGLSPLGLLAPVVYFTICQYD